MPASRADMKVHVSTIAAVLLSLLATTLAAQRGGAGQGAREVTVTAIPGVVAAGATWSVAWQGRDNADGLVGTADGGSALRPGAAATNQQARCDGSRVCVSLRHTRRRLDRHRLEGTRDRGRTNLHRSRRTPGIMQRAHSRECADAHTRSSSPIASRASHSDDSTISSSTQKAASTSRLAARTTLGRMAV